MFDLRKELCCQKPLVLLRESRFTESAPATTERLRAELTAELTTELSRGIERRYAAQAQQQLVAQRELYQGKLEAMQREHRRLQADLALRLYAYAATLLRGGPNPNPLTPTLTLTLT